MNKKKTGIEVFPRLHVQINHDTHTITLGKDWVRFIQDILLSNRLGQNMLINPFPVVYKCYQQFKNFLRKNKYVEGSYYLTDYGGVDKVTIVTERHFKIHLLVGIYQRVCLWIVEQELSEGTRPRRVIGYINDDHLINTDLIYRTDGDVIKQVWNSIAWFTPSPIENITHAYTLKQGSDI